MTTSTINPSFPDIHTKQDLPVASYLRLTKSDVAKVYQHVYDDKGTSELVMAFMMLKLDMIDQYPMRPRNDDDPCLMNLWDWCSNDFHYTQEDQGIALPKHGDYHYFVIKNHCHNMAPVAVEIAKLITGHDDWKEVTNNYHSAVYSPSRRMLYDILADVMGDDAQQHPEATCFDDGSQSGCLPNWNELDPINQLAKDALAALS